MDDRMNKFICLILVLSVTACSTCKSSDSPDVCRTKQRDHGQPRADNPPPQQIHPAIAANGLRWSASAFLNAGRASQRS
jgi:hypothetical protein